MQNNNLKSSDDGGFFYLIEIILKNKRILIFTLSISILLGGILGVFFYNYNQQPTIYKQKDKVNINYLISETTVYSDKQLIELLNKSLPSAYNYEKWSNNNADLSKLLSQTQASALLVSPKLHTVTIKLNSQGYLDAVTSYLSYTAQTINNKIKNINKLNLKKRRGIVETSINEKRYTLKQKQKRFRFIETEKEIVISELREIYEHKIVNFENEITNKRLVIKSAREELSYIETNMSEEIKNTLTINLRRLDLINTISVTELIIENLKKRILGVPPLEITLDIKLRELNFEKTILENEIAKINEKIKIELNQLVHEIEDTENNVISIGRKSRYTYEDEPQPFSIIGVLVTSAVIGILLGVFFIFFKEEYKKYKKKA